MDNKEKKLTGMTAKSYHGNMTENGNEIKKDAPKEPVRDGKVPVENKKEGVRPEGKKDEGVQGKKTGEQPIDWNNTTPKQREEFAKARKALEGEPEGEKQKGIFDIFLDFLKALFGVDDEKAEKMIADSEAMRGVQAYWRIKPQNKWEENDYARVIFMLNADGSKEATAIKDELYKDAEDKGIPKDRIKDKDRAREVIFSKTAELDKEYSGILSKEGKALNDQERKAEMVHRAVVMTALLWREQKDAVVRLGANELEELGEYVESLRLGDKYTEDMNDLRFLQRAVAWVKKNNVRNTTSGGSGQREERKDTNEGSEEADEKTRRRQEKGKDEKSEAKGGDKTGVKEGRKEKGEEAFKKFSSENKKIISEKIKSNDPEYMEHVLKFFEKHNLDPKVRKEAIEAFLRAKEFDEKGGVKQSEDAKKIVSLLREELVKLSIRGGGGQGNERDEKEEVVRQDDKQDNSSDQGGKAGRKDTMGGRGYASANEVDEDKRENEKNEAQDSKTNNGKGKGEKPVSLMNDKELRDFYGEKFEHMAKDVSVLPEILQVNKDMLAELIEIRRSIGELVKSQMNTLVDYSYQLRLEPEKYKELRKDYIELRAREMKIEEHLEEFTRGEKRVLGGEKDYHLYGGNIDQVIDERMKRVEYFIARKPDGKIDWGKLGKDSPLNPDAPNIDEKERNERKKFLKRTVGRYEEFIEDGTLAKQEGLYFQEIQRWVGNILENSVYGYDGKNGALRMPKGVYDRFVKIKDMPAQVYKYKDEKEYADKLLETIRTLREEKFLDYFRNRDERENIKGVSYLNLEGKDVDPHSAEIARGSYGYPSSIEATMLLIAEDRGAEYRTGAVHELIDASGKFHPENFILWIRKETNKLTDWDPWTKIEPMGISFKAGFSSINLYDILFLPQYTQHQEIEMTGDVTGWYDNNKRVSFSVDWGAKKEHPDMDYDTRVNRILIDEPWLAGVEHNNYVRLYDVVARSDPKAYFEAKKEIAQSNNYARSGLWSRRLMLPSHGGHDGKDTENYLKKKKQGKMGEAVNAGQLFYRYYTDFSEKYLEEKEGVIGVREKNMAYEALDIDGASIFLTSIAENALGMADPKAGKEIKKVYGNFILDRIGDIEERYKGQGDEGGKKILIEKCREEVRKLRDEDQDKLKISFDTFEKLTDLQMKIEKVVLRKTEVTEKEKRNFKLEDKKVVVKEEVEKEIKKKMRENIGVFLTDVMEIKIPKMEVKDGEETGKFEHKANGDIAREEIGEAKVFVDRAGRVVTKKEWMEIFKVKKGEEDKQPEGKKTMKQIITDFTNNFVKDENDLGAYKEYIEAMEEVEDVEEEYRQVSSKGDQKKLDKINKELVEKKEKLKSTKEEHDKFSKRGEENSNTSVYDHIFKRRESMGLAMLTKVANIERKKLNYWVGTRPSEDSGRKLVRSALMKAIGATYDLDNDEQLYAHDRIWYPLEYMEVGAFNNTSRVVGGVQMGTNYNRFPDARKNYQGLSTMGGSLETLDEVNLREPTLFERLKMKKRGEGLPNGIPQHSLIEIMKGGDGGIMLPRHLRKFDGNPDEIYESQHNWEHADVIDGLPRLENLRKLIVEEHPELGSFHEIVTINAWGVKKVDHAKARKLFDAYWNDARLAFGSHQIDYNKMIWADGREISVQDYFFGPHTKETQKKMKGYYEKMEAKALKDGKPEDADAYKKMASEIIRNPAMAFVMNMVTSEIHDHMAFDSSYEMWSTQIVEEIAWIMEEKFQQISDEKAGKKGEHKEGHKPPMRPSMMPYELFNILLGVQEGDSMDKYMFWDLFLTLVSGVISGFGEAQKEIEDELTGQPVKQWIG